MKKIILAGLIFFQFSAFSQTLKDSLVAFYPFTGNAIDSSGKGNNGVVTGASLTTDRFGKSNSAYSFNGTSNEIRVSNAFKGKQPFTTNASVCYWIKTATTKTAAAILTYHSACSNNKNDMMTFYLNNAAGSHFLYNTLYWHSPIMSVDESTVTDNVWHFICYTYDHDTANLYVDGTNMQKSTVTPEPGFMFDKFTDLVIGNISSNGCAYDFYFEGSIDDIRIYNRTLSQKEVTNIKNNKLNIQPEFIVLKPSLYPNPGQQKVEISNLDADITCIELVDMTGRVIFSTPNSTDNNSIDISAFANGFYNVLYLDNNRKTIHSEKLIISK